MLHPIIIPPVLDFREKVSIGTGFGPLRPLAFCPASQQAPGPARPGVCLCVRVSVWCVCVSGPVLSCPVLSCLVSSRLVSSRLVLSRLVSSRLVLSCLVFDLFEY